MRPHASLAVGALVLACAVFVFGCSADHQSTSPGTPSANSAAITPAVQTTTDAVLEGPTALAAGGLLVDLRQGRVTRLDRVFRIQDVGGPLEFHSVVESRITGSATYGGHEYQIEETTIQEDEGLPFVESTLPLRQDRSGLFFYQPEKPRGARPALELGEADASGLPRDLAAVWAKTADRPAAWRTALARTLTKVALVRGLLAGGGVSAAARGSVTGLVGPPGGVLQDEVTLLRYPLRPGASWDGLVGFNVWTVEAVGNSELPIGRTWTARLDIDLPQFLGPEDKVTFWYGAPGEVRHEQHFVETTTDQNGNPIGTFTTDDIAVITSYTPGSDELP